MSAANETSRRLHSVENMHQSSVPVAGAVVTNPQDVAVPGYGMGAGVSDDTSEMVDARLGALAEMLSDVIWETDESGRFEYLSPRIGEIAGWAPAELFGHSFFSFVAPISPGRAASPGAWGMPFIDLRSPKPFRDVLAELKTRGGETVLVRVSGLPIEASRSETAERGAQTRFHGVMTEVTDTFSILERARVAETQLSAVIDAIPEAIVIFDRADRLVLRNDASLALVPDAGSILRVGADRREVKAALFASGSASTPWPLERWVAEGGPAPTGLGDMIDASLPDGRMIRLMERRLADGGVLLAAINVTRTVEREQALTRAKESAEFANRTKTDFLANISHELRTPLNAIIGFSEIMRDELLGPIGTKHYIGYLGNILESGRHVLSLINDILDISKAEAGKMTLNEDVFDLSATCTSCRSLVQERAWRGGLDLALSLPPEAVMLRGDERKIRQILLNLLSNAIKFTMPGGRVTLSLAINEAGGVDMVVSDTGIGIAEADQPTALAPFGQVDSRINRTCDGTGLGLPISVAMTELHQGTLSVRSTIEVGTTVTVSLPPARLVGLENEATI